MFIILITLTMNVMAQSDYDYINRDKFSIIRPGADSKAVSQMKVGRIRSIQDAEQQFGKNYKTTKEIVEMTKTSYDRMDYDDGLELMIPENKTADLWFNVTSDNYAMILEDGTEIKVGMKAEDLQAIFPNSYSKRKTITDTKGKIGKITFIVFFSYTVDNKVYLEEKWIRFILSEENSILEEFHVHEPL